MRPIKLELKEQIPVSSNSEIAVELLESTKGMFNEQTGTLSWDLELAPGESKRLVFMYEVKYPKGKRVNI